MLELILYSLVGGVFSLIGGLLLLWKEKLTLRFITPLLSFGAGAFLSAAFLDILPEAIELSGEPHPVTLGLIVGFISFFALERGIMKLHTPHARDKDHSAHTESLPLLLIAGDSFHNFLDGIVIALAYVANPTLGLTATLAIAAHEIPQEIGDFAVLMKVGWKKSSIIAVNIAQSLLTIPGVLLGYTIGISLERYLPILLGATCGIFIYIAASDIIPEIHHRAGHKQFFAVILPAIAAIILIFQLTKLAHGQ